MVQESISTEAPAAEPPAPEPVSAAEPVAAAAGMEAAEDYSIDGILSQVGSDPEPQESAGFQVHFDEDAE